MKTKFSILFISLFVFSCKKNTTNSILEIVQKIAPISDSILENGVIYEANNSQYSSEGTFKPFTKDIPNFSIDL